MKEIQYQFEEKREVVDTGYCLGLLYYIMNLGTHPVAYIRIPENHKYFKKDMHEVDIDVHGGITYAKEGIYVENNQKIDGWFIGWDYAHYGDYLGYEERIPIIFRTDGKKWTTEEIFKEVKAACYQIQN